MGKCKGESLIQSRDVVVLGTATIDHVTHVSQLPKSGEDIRGKFTENIFGGLGANQSVAAAKLGASTALLSKVGRDSSGEEYRKYLQSQNVDVDHVGFVDNGQTDLNEVAVSEEGQYLKISLARASNSLTSKDVFRHKTCVRNPQVLICHLELNMFTSICALKQFMAKTTILHMSPMRKNIPPELIKLPDILVMDQFMASKLFDMEEVKTPYDARKAASILIQKGAKSVIIVMDDLSAVHMSKANPSMCTHVPAGSCSCSGDTGVPCGGGGVSSYWSRAVDGFIGSLAYHIAKFPDVTREHHISAANACSVCSVGKPGTHASFPGESLAHKNLSNVTPTFAVIPEMAPGVETSNEKTLQEEAPEVVVPEEMAPDVVVPIEEGPEDVALEEVELEEVVLEEVAPKEVVPEEVAPEEVTAEEVAPAVPPEELPAEGVQAKAAN